MHQDIGELIKKRCKNLSEFSRMSEVPYGTLYDIANGNTQFEKIGIGVFGPIHGEEPEVLRAARARRVRRPATGEAERLLRGAERGVEGDHSRGRGLVRGRPRAAHR